ncbi:autoinhibited Ca2+-ATPase 11, partial [Prunus dulcis]
MGVTGGEPGFMMPFFCPSSRLTEMKTCLPLLCASGILPAIHLTSVWAYGANPAGYGSDFGFRPHGRPVDAVGDYHRRKNQEKVLRSTRTALLQYLKRFSAEKDKDQQHMLFLLYWLNRFVFPNRSSAVLLEYRHLAEALHNHTDVGLGPTVYFPRVRFPDIVLPEDQVLALPLISAEVPKRSLEEYLMLFRHCTKRSAAQWQVVIRRTYPWFQTGFRLFEKEPEDEAARTDFRKKFLSITLPRDLPHGGGKPPNYHLGAEVYHPNFCARQLGCPQLIPLKSYRSCNRASSWRDADDLEVHKDARCAVNKINNSTDALYPSWEPNSCSSADFDAWWQTRFQSLPASVTALKVLFDGWENGTFLRMGTLKPHDPDHQGHQCTNHRRSFSDNQCGWTVCSGWKSRGLELPSADEKMRSSRANPCRGCSSGRRKEKGLLLSGQHHAAWYSRGVKWNTVAVEETAAVPATTSGTDEELREAFEEVEQEKELQELEECLKKKWQWRKRGEFYFVTDEIPAEVIESIALAQKQQKGPSAELTSSELALFEDAEAEHSTAAQRLRIRWSGEVPKAVALAAVSSPLKPPIVAMPIHSFPGSSATASFADPELEEFEAMDLDAQLDRLEKLSSPPSRQNLELKIWQSTELEFDEDKGALDQLMKDLDLLHRQNMAPKPILEMGLSLARDVLNLHDRYEDLRPTFKTSEFCKATHEANLADLLGRKQNWTRWWLDIRKPGLLRT